MAPGLRGRHGEPLHKEGQFSGRNCSKQQRLASWLGEIGTFLPSLPGSGLGKGKFQSWLVRTHLHLLLISHQDSPGEEELAANQAHGYQVATWGKLGSKNSSPYSSAPFLYKPLPANPAPGFGPSFYLQPHYYQSFASKISSEN